MATDHSKFVQLVSRRPEPSIAELLDELKPPREFFAARLSNYIPHSEYVSQSVALERAEVFLGRSRGRKLFAKKENPPPGIYLDGGFGVGKTHLLAGMWHEFSGTKAFGSFIAYTSLIGAIGFAGAVEAFSKYQLICIDEFELDDPGDTMMMSRLINELASKGVRFAATSNTPPNALGEGRFAAADFQREILGISSQFEMVRIDGEDHRHRPVTAESIETSAAEYESWLDVAPAATTAVADFAELLKHLATIHPSRYGFLLEGLEKLGITGIWQLDDQVDALRLVAFIDRAYEAQVQIRATGHPLTDVFAAKYLSGGYRKKYLRAVSRIGALTN